MDRVSPTTCEIFQPQRMLVWGVRSAVAAAVLVLWLLLHYRQKASISVRILSLKNQREGTVVLPNGNCLAEHRDHAASISALSVVSGVN